MLWCLRVMFLAVPLGMGAVLLWVIEEGRQLEFRRDDDLVFVVGREIETISPLASSSGVERQIETMMFDRLFRRDDELVIRGNLAEAWGYHQQVALFFADKKKAEVAEAQIASLVAAEKKKNPASRFEAVGRIGTTLSISFSTYDEGNVEKVLELLGDLDHLPVLKVRLSMKGAVKESWADFKKGAAEKGQIKREWIEDNRAVVLFVAGDVEQFLKELRFYYESNHNLEPHIELIGQQACVDVVEWVMTLRDDIEWHDGRPVTSRDVLFSYEEMMRPVAASPLRGDFSHVASVRDLDARHLIVECREFYAPIAESWERLPILPSHLLAGKKAADWELFFRQPVGTGPYALEGEIGKGELVLKHHAGYFRGTPQQERVKFRLMLNHDTRIREMRTGGVDALWPTAKEIRQTKGDARFRVLDDSYRRQAFVAWNIKKSKFQSPEVRRALAHFIDVSALIDDNLKGGSRLCRGIFFPEAWFCKKTIELPEFDPEKGKQLLEGAGWNFDGRDWVDSDDQTLSFKLLVDRDSAEHMKVAGLLAERWREQGVAVELVPLSWSKLVTEHLNTRNFDAALVSWELGFGRDQYRVWHSSQTDPGGANFFGLHSGPVDRALEALRKETEPGKIKMLAESLQEKILQLQPCLFLNESADAVVLRKGAVKLARPVGEGAWTDEAPTMSPAGLENEWRWWRKDTPGKEAESGKP